MKSAFGVEHEISKSRTKVMLRLKEVAARNPGVMSSRSGPFQPPTVGDYARDSVKRYGQAGKGYGFGTVGRNGKPRPMEKFTDAQGIQHPKNWSKRTPERPLKNV